MATNSSNNNSSNRSSTRRRTTASARTSRTKFYFNITINAFIGCMLAAIGTCLLFQGGQDNITPVAITIVGVFCVCLGAVAIVRYLRKNEGTDMGTLVVGIIQAVIGVILIVMANAVTQYVYLAIGIALIAYGIWTIIQAVRHGNTFALIMGILLIVVGILVLLYTFEASGGGLEDWGYILIGIAAYSGAVIFLFF